jgi:hypothetical protein
MLTQTGWFMVSNATFNNILIISLRLVLLLEENEAPEENHRHAASYWQTLSQHFISSTTPHERGSNSQLKW